MQKTIGQKIREKTWWLNLGGKIKFILCVEASSEVGGTEAVIVVGLGLVAGVDMTTTEDGVMIVSFSS